MKQAKLVCGKCGRAVRKRDRWHRVQRRFLFWSWRRVEHRDCADPEVIHKNVRVLEVPHEQRIGDAGAGG